MQYVLDELRGGAVDAEGAAHPPLSASGAVGQDQGKQIQGKTFTPAPKGFDARRDGIERGELKTVEYDSTTVGVKRKAHVYTPPGYSKDQKYPVLYLLHGIGGNGYEWTKGGAAHVILDNLYADKKAVPMVVVLPNGRAAKDVTPLAKRSRLAFASAQRFVALPAQFTDF